MSGTLSKQASHEGLLSATISLIFSACHSSAPGCLAGVYAGHPPGWTLEAMIRIMTIAHLNCHSHGWTDERGKPQYTA